MTAALSGCGFIFISTLQPGQITFGGMRLVAMIAASMGERHVIRLFSESRPGRTPKLSGAFTVNVV
jgi:hypothetical protein